MSLVNRTLHNLEQRQHQETPSLLASSNIDISSKEASQNASKVRLAGLGMALLAAAIYLYQEYGSKHPDMPEMLAGTTDRQAGNTPNLAPKPEPTADFYSEPDQPGHNSNPAEILPVDAANETSVAIPEPELKLELQPVRQTADSRPTPTNNSAIRVLLDAAASALAADRLTTPDNDNALDHYQRVLQKQPHNVEAKTGIQAIVQRYIELARKQIQVGNISKALLLNARGLSLAPQNEQLLTMQQSLLSGHPPPGQTQGQIIDGPVAKQAVAKEPVTADRKPADIQRTPATHRIATGENQAALENTTSPPDSMLVNRSDRSIDEALASKFRKQAAQGNPQSAISELEALQAQEQLGEKTTMVLAELYLQQNRAQDAIKLAEGNTLLAKEQAAYTIARSQVAENNLALALTTLESQTPAIQKFPEYYALLAGIYQQAGQHAKAVKLYNQLIRLQPKTFNHRLGLAAALDSLNSDKALRAFRHALPMIPEQYIEIRQYVRQRIDQLAVL